MCMNSGDAGCVCYRIHPSIDTHWLVCVGRVMMVMMMHTLAGTPQPARARLCSSRGCSCRHHCGAR